ncbi:MAG: choice-of-anchor L domain-containing protein [Meiothermus sp.]|nr:choice-of-anchor L domain-containing protein [Meiothermus sp.]
MALPAPLTRVFALALLLCSFAQAQLSFTNSTTAQTLANALAGPGVTVVANSATLTRATTNQNNTGTFSGGTTGGAGPVVGIGSGVLLNTGSFATSVAGPNNRKGSSAGGSQLTDADLTSLAGATANYDTVLLTFSVVPSGRSLNFQYVFGSEEYPEYVCTSFNDAMGIFVRGPGISGPYANGAVNVATLPSGDRISINNINGGQIGYQGGATGTGCVLGNNAYYVDNGDPNNATLPNSALFTNTQLDGFTRPLRSRVSVTPGQTYVVKIAIADTGDAQYDSALFIGLISSQSDWGDAPSTYGTSTATNGPLHDIDSRIFIGPTQPDVENDGQPGAGADGDNLNGTNDENTLTTFPTLTSSTPTYTLSAIPLTNTTGLPATLAGWIDFNRNGLFDASERATVSVASGATSATLTWSGLSGLSIGTTYLRLRLSSALDFVANPLPTGGYDDGEVEDYALSIVFGAVVSGTVYSDLQPNGTRDSGESWSGGPTVFVNLIQAGTVVQSAQVASGGGAYSFSAVLPGSYSLVLGGSIGATTPASPAGWMAINPSPALLSVTVTASNMPNQNFGLFNGYRLAGLVFRDDGRGGGTANNALQDGGEPGLGGVTLTATAGPSTRSAATDATGAYDLYIPASFSSVTLGHAQTPATGHNNAGSAVTLASSFSDPAARQRSLGTLANGSSYSYNFGVVWASELRPDQSGQATSPGIATYRHTFRPGTLGSLSLAATGALTYRIRRAAGCTALAPSDTLQPLPLSVVVDAAWPRDPNGRLSACELELLVLVPAGRPSGAVDIAQLTSSLTWAGNASVTEQRNVIDTTTVVAQGALRLEKAVRNVTQNVPAAGAYTTNVAGRPGDTLEYCIAFRNPGAAAVSSAVLTDPIPFFTNYTASSLRLGATALSDAADADAGELVSGLYVLVRLGNLTAGQTGQVCYRVTVR